MLEHDRRRVTGTATANSDRTGPALTSRPIFVAGLARSGTTLLQACLGAHPRIAAAPEMYFALRVSGFADHYGDLRDDDRLRTALHDTIDFPTLEPLALDEKDLFRRVAAGARTYAALFDVVMTALAERTGRARWSDKTPGQQPATAWRLFPDAQVVHIVRDPRDVVASSMASPWITDSALQTARAWRTFNVQAARDGAMAGAGRYLRVRYEDLASEPRTVLRLVSTFLEEDFDDRMLSPVERAESGAIASIAGDYQSRASAAIDTSSIGRHEMSLGRLARSAVVGVTSAELAAYGYEPPRRRAVALGRTLSAVDHLRSMPARTMTRLRPPRLTPGDRHRAVRELVELSFDRLTAGDTTPRANDEGQKGLWEDERRA